MPSRPPERSNASVPLDEDEKGRRGLSPCARYTPDPCAKAVNCSEAVRLRPGDGVTPIASKYFRRWTADDRVEARARERLADGVAEDLRELERRMEETLPRRDVPRLGEQRFGDVDGKAARPRPGQPTPRTGTGVRSSRSRNDVLHHRSQTSFKRSTGASLRASAASACSLARTCASVSPGSVAMRDLTAIASPSARSRATSSKSGSAREAPRRPRWRLPGHVSRRRADQAVAGA